MELFIFRHAWAEQRDDSRWPDDGLRPLSEAGRERFAAMVGKLACRDVAPGIVATSPLVRCRQTTEVLAEGLLMAPEVVELDALRPGSDRDALLEWTAAKAAEHEQIAWVGHAPDVDMLAAALIGDGDAWIRFAKGAVAAIRFGETVQTGGGELRWLATAKLLGC